MEYVTPVDISLDSDFNDANDIQNYCDCITFYLDTGVTFICKSVATRHKMW